MKTLLLLFLSLTLPPSFQQAVLYLSGASCIEDLSEDELQRYQTLASHPADLNRSGRSRLLATGLLSPFQVASLLDYRTRSGEVLSWTELGLVDGFSHDIVEALRLFFVLGVQDAPPGRREDRRFRQTVTLRGGARASGELAGGLKYEASLGERADFYWSTRTTYSNPRLSPGTISAAWYGKGVVGQVIAGYFNARFGQGLVQWSGFQLSGYSTVGAFRKNGTGLSPTGSWSADLLGVAADWNFGAWRLSTAYSFLGNRPIANLTHTGRRLTAGLTATHQAASLEARLSLPGWSVFGEAAASYQGEIRGLAGAVWTPRYGHRIALLGRWLGTGKQYSGVAAGYGGPALDATIDAAWRPDTRSGQYKALVQWHPDYTWLGLAWQPVLRLQGRLRPEDDTPLRTEARGMLTVLAERWTVAGRYDAVWCRGFAWHWYAEAGYRSGNLSCYLRGGLFKVDDWEDRIYVYERDAPGSFTVPARYGRGWDASVYAAWTINRHHTVWLRLETVQYPWNLTEKPGRTEVRVQYRFRM
ncbi:MAG: hypothetical protein IJV37_08790 [Bacteroidales bacterium]|nr:hypothetical protein [Bacteroidales bacterium]